MNPLILLDYCTCNTTVVLIVSGEGKDEYVDLVGMLSQSNFQWKSVTEQWVMNMTHSLVENASTTETQWFKQFENIILLCHSPIPLFSTSVIEGCYTIKEEDIISHIQKWNQYPYVLSPGNLPDPLCGTDGPDTFVGITMTKRIPDIIRRTSQSIHNLKDKDKRRYEELAKTIQHDGSIEMCDSHTDHLLDVLFYCKVNRAHRNGLTWHSISWWLAEHYEYVLMNHIQQSLSSPDIPVDPFYYLKRDSLFITCESFAQLLKPVIVAVKENAVFTKELFEMILLHDLWGNKADLSMSSGKIEKHPVLDPSNNALLVNDVDTAWEYLQSKPLHKIAIFADNVGLELLCDLMLIMVLLHYYTDISIVYVVKSDPVFVSDVTLPDIQPTLDALSHLDDSVEWMVQNLMEARENHRLSFFACPFLCTASPGWDMPLSFVELLSGLDLTITKGDANYRRLVGDLHWPFETSMHQVLEYFPCPLLLMRTLKSDVCIGVNHNLQELANKLDQSWSHDGKFGVIQFYQPSHCK